jgi:hypothetical protein
MHHGCSSLVNAKCMSSLGFKVSDSVTLSFLLFSDDAIKGAGQVLGSMDHGTMNHMRTALKLLAIAGTFLILWVVSGPCACSLWNPSIGHFPRVVCVCSPIKTSGIHGLENGHASKQHQEEFEAKA